MNIESEEIKVTMSRIEFVAIGKLICGTSKTDREICTITPKESDALSNMYSVIEAYLGGE